MYLVHIHNSIGDPNPQRTKCAYHLDAMVSQQPMIHPGIICELQAVWTLRERRDT